MSPSCVVVPAPDAERTVRYLQRERALDPTRKIQRRDDEVWIPVQETHVDDPRGWAKWVIHLSPQARLAADAAPLAREPTRTPRELVQARLPAALQPEVPEKWEQHGDVLVLKLPGAHAREIARAFADALGLRTVIHDPAGVEGELREMRGELLVGSDPIATHVEDGVRYRFDASRIMFSSGNLAERMRAARIPAAGETVVDMFAGIGYFALPVAMRSGAAKVFALEKNPLSHRFLVENAKLNEVEDVLVPWLGDNRDFPQRGIADRVLMGYFPGTDAFLPTALELLKPRGGVIHYHNTAHESVWRDELTRHVLDAARACGAAVAIEEARVVKSHSPGVVHAVLVARVRR